MWYLIQQMVGIMMIFLFLHLTSPEIIAVLSCPVKANKKKTTSLHSCCKELWNCFGDISGSTEMEQQLYWTILSCPSCCWHRRWLEVSKWRQDSLNSSVTSYCQSRLVPMAVCAHMVSIWTELSLEEQTCLMETHLWENRKGLSEAFIEVTPMHPDS